MTEEKKSMVPKLRFPEFTETWEQRKFQEITQRVSTSSISSIDFPSVEYEDIEAGSGTLNKDVKVEDRQLPAFFYSLPRGSLKTATVA